MTLQGHQKTYMTYHRTSTGCSDNLECLFSDDCRACVIDLVFCKVFDKQLLWRRCAKTWKFLWLATMNRIERMERSTCPASVDLNIVNKKRNYFESKILVILSRARTCPIWGAAPTSSSSTVPVTPLKKDARPKTVKAFRKTKGMMEAG